MKRLYNHHFPTPSYLTMNSFSIDISDRSIKYGELVATSHGLRLGKYGKEKIPTGVVVSGKIEKENELIRVLKNIKEKENIHFIRVSLPEEQVYLFTLSLPKSNEEKNIREMILLQIEEHIPLKAPDAIFDYDITGGDNQNMSVEVVAISGAIMDDYLSVFEKVGLVPISFELDAQAIARAVIPRGDNSPVMVVDFGETRTGVSISNNGRVVLATTLSIGGSDLTGMIAKNFSLSFEEAEKMKHKYGLNKVSKDQDIFPIVLNGISVLRDELNKQYSYWETHNTENNKHEQISRIILCGGDANLAGLSDYMELSMKIKVENANVWVNILEKENSIPEMPFDESLSYATILGLSLGGYMYDSQNVINILPAQEKKTLHKEYWIRFLIIFSQIVSLVIIIATILIYPSYLISQAKEKTAESQLELFNKENPEIEVGNIDNNIKDINSKLDLLSKAEPSYQVNDKVINSILSTRTAGITFSQIIFNKTTTKISEEVNGDEIADLSTTSKKTKTVDVSILEVHGIATNRDTLRNFKTALDNNQNFKEVDLPISSFLGKNDLAFTISMKIK